MANLFYKSFNKKYNLRGDYSYLTETFYDPSSRLDVTVTVEIRAVDEVILGCFSSNAIEYYYIPACWTCV